MAKRDGLGVILKSAPKIGSNTDDLQRVIDYIYRDLNDILNAVNRPNSTSLTQNHKGKSGDIRLYQGSGLDGSTGYFLQGKFKEGWATVHLSLDQQNPENIDVSSPEAQTEGPEPFITKYGVNFSNLQVNSTVGQQSDQVAFGNHAHEDHWGNSYVGGTHLNDIHFTRIAENQDTSSLLTDLVSNSGTAITAARSDHTHKIDTAHSFTWKADQTFGEAYGNTGKKVIIKGPTTGQGNYALDVKGDVSIDGELVVSYGETQSNAVTLSGDVTMNSDSIDAGGLVDYTNTTRIYGPTKFDSGVKISKAGILNNDAWHYDTTLDDGKPALIIETSDESGQLRLQYNSTNFFDMKVDTGGNLILAPTGRIELQPNGTNWLDPGEVLPKSSGTIDLGSDTRKWRTIVANELRIDNLVAQDVMATIGGVIVVAPTNVLTRDLASAASGDCLYLQYNDPNFKDTWVEMKNSGKFEAFYIANVVPTLQAEGDYSYTIGNRNSDGSGDNAWSAGDAIIATGNSTGTVSGNKGFIELSSTGTAHNSYGPRITLYGRKDGDGNTWNSALPLVQMGTLKDTVDYSSSTDTHGLAIGNDVRLTTVTGFKGLTADADNGLRLWNTDIQLYNGSSKRVELLSDGRFRLGANLGLTDGNWDIDEGQGVGLSWDGSSLVVNGVINITGGILPGGQSWEDFEGSIDDLSEQLDNLDTAGMDDYAAAQYIINAIGGNVILDNDMEWNPSNESSYNNMSLLGGTNTYAEKSSTHKMSGDYSLKIASRHQSNVVSGGNQAHVDCHQTDLTDSDTYYPVVQGLKISTKMWYLNNFGYGTPAEGMFRFGFKVFNPAKDYYSWVFPSKSTNSPVEMHLWKKAEGSWTVPNAYEMKNAAGDVANKVVGWIVPMFSADTWGDANDTQYTNTLSYGYIDDVFMEFDTGLAQPASPSGEAGFFAGSDLFGIHDGDNWRIQFSVDNQETSDVGNSYMALRDSNGARQVSWDGDTFDIKGILNISGSSDDINLSEGNITIGDSGVIRTPDMGFSTNTADAGFILGIDGGDSDVAKFIIKNNKADSDPDQEYIKVDTSPSASNTVEIKGALYADKLADVTPQIADAGGVYRPLTQVFTHFDGPQDAQNGNKVGDFSSSGPVLTDVRNGALVTVHIYAEGKGPEINWVNPRIIYSKYGHGTGAYIPNVISGEVLKNGFRLQDPWKEVDWVPYGGTSDGRQASEPIWFKIADFTKEYINGNANTPVLRINSGSSGNLANADISNSNLRDNFFDTFSMITFAMEDQNATPNAHQEFILKNLWQLNTVNSGDGSSYIKIPINSESGNGYEDFSYYNGDSSDGPIPGTSDMWKIWPCNSISNHDLFYRRWGHDDGNDHDGTVAWDNMTDSLVEAMVVRPFNYQYYADTEDSGFVPHFSHTYKFYVDIPDLHEGTHAGKVQIHFGTGIPWTGYRTLSERGEIVQVTYNVDVDNAG